MILRICGIAVLTAIVGMMLGEMGFKGRRLFGTVSAVMLLIGVLESVGTVFSEISSLTSAAGVSEIALTALKIVGVGYVSGISCDVASELGEGGVARAVELSGRVEMLLITLPYLKEILEVGIGLIK
jgi:stage III sporulation protein AD